MTALITDSGRVKMIIAERLLYFDNEDANYCEDCAHEFCDGEVTEFSRKEDITVLCCDTCGKEIPVTYLS